jgi:hypothetical protein
MVMMGVVLGLMGDETAFFFVFGVLLLHIAFDLHY